MTVFNNEINNLTEINSTQEVKTFRNYKESTTPITTSDQMPVETSVMMQRIIDTLNITPYQNASESAQTQSTYTDTITPHQVKT